MRADRLALAAVVATIAFGCYSGTLLPGVDLGDTGGFQAGVLWPETSARQAYPLYYALATPFVHLLSPDNPARGLNLFSALCGAAAAGLLTWLVASITASRTGGLVAGLLLAFSYTFWTQAVIAEVYTLHLALVAVVLIGARAWETHQTHWRLAGVCALYALAFGNHLSTILLFVPLLAFVTAAHPQPLHLLRPGVIASGLLIAAVGALQYTPNMLAVWSHLEAPASWSGRLSVFWFDVTKADWRATMVLGVPAVNVTDRLAMWAWDARQQFGVAGLALALTGAVSLWWTARPWAVLVTLAYIVNTLFALTYNVGDTHVFFLPGHFFTALSAGVGAAALVRAVGWDAARPPGPARRLLRPVLQVGVLLLAAWSGWETWPATDRHQDRRGEQLAAQLFLGLTERNALLVSRMNWDQENALLYASRYLQEAPLVRLYEVLPHFPYLVRDNLSIGRDIVLTEDAAARVVGAYGDEYPITRDAVPQAPPLAATVMRIPRGTPYVLTVLEPLRDYHFDAGDLDEALTTLTGRRGHTGKPYEVFAGIAGERAGLHESSDRPFVRDVSLAGDSFRIRMDSWMPTDTFRRGSFGHVLHGRQPILFVERGVSLVWLGRDGTPEVAYAGGLYAPQPRYRISVPTSRLALR